MHKFLFFFLAVRPLSLSVLICRAIDMTPAFRGCSICWSLRWMVLWGGALPARPLSRLLVKWGPIKSQRYSKAVSDETAAKMSGFPTDHVS